MSGKGAERCPKCSGRLKVIQPEHEGYRTIRYRSCANCGHRQKTQEVQIEHDRMPCIERIELSTLDLFLQKQKSARHVLAKAIRHGKITKPARCSKCQRECVPDGHHIDYSRPLDVIWLCRQCHSAEHTKRIN